MRLKSLYNSIIKESESEIPDVAKRLIQDMIDNKTQRKTLRLKDEKMFDKVLQDFKPAVDTNLLVIKQNPIDKKEIWFSLGSASYDKINWEK